MNKKKVKKESKLLYPTQIPQGLWQPHTPKVRPSLPQARKGYGNHDTPKVRPSLPQAHKDYGNPDAPKCGSTTFTPPWWMGLKKTSLPIYQARKGYGNPDVMDGLRASYKGGNSA